MADQPQGKFWCPKCVMKQEFVVAEGFTFNEPDSAIECWVCGHVHHKIRKELEDDGITHRKTPKLSPAIPKWMRHDAKVRLRREFVAAAESSGFDRGNFTMPGRRTKR